MTNQPSVTACLTAYDAADFIEPVLASLAEQTWPNLRILVSDDCSDNGTSELVERYAADSEADFQVFRQATRLGWVDDTNLLLDRVESEFFFLCYHDDTLAPHCVEETVGAVLADENCIGAFSDIELTELDEEKVIRNFDTIFGLTNPVTRGLNIIASRGFP